MSQDGERNLLTVSSEIERSLEKTVKDQKALKSIQKKLSELYALLNKNESTGNSVSFRESPQFYRAWPESTFYRVGPIEGVRLTGATDADIKVAYEAFEKAMEAKDKAKTPKLSDT